MTEQFRGFGPGAHEFFEQLAQHNDRDWFLAHRDTYLHDIREPLEAMLDELEDEFGPARLFRINRDVRFSKDKSPYKTNQAALVDRGGRGACYLSIEADGVVAGVGTPHFDRGQLDRYREAVAGSPGEALDELIEALGTRSVTVGIVDGVDATHLKRVPAPFPQDHPRARLLKLKHIVAMRRWDRPTWLHSRRAIGAVRDAWREMAPLGEWLERHVGPPGSE